MATLKRESKLTKTLIEQEIEGLSQGERFLWDVGKGAVSGFGIRIKSTGNASFFIQYRNQEGRTRRLTLGKFGTLTVDEARKLARQKLAGVDKGEDPSAERHQLQQSINVRELCSDYLKDAKLHIKASTYRVDESRINSHVIPLLGNRRVSSLTTADLEKFQKDIALGKTAKSKPDGGKGGYPRGGRGAASRTLGMLSTILEYARRKGVIDINPARSVKKFKDGENDRFLSHEELCSLGETMHQMVDKYEAHETAAAIITTLLLTGCRKNEIQSLPWDWVDEKNQCIRFGDTKTGKQVRPIGKAAMDFIANQQRYYEGDKLIPWVFPATVGNGHFVGTPKVFKKICDRAGITDASLHVTRHTFSSIAEELGFSELTRYGLLGQKARGINARYTHIPDRALMSAADTVSAKIMALLCGDSDDKVIPMHVRERS